MSFRKASRLITYITSAIPPLLLMALIIFASYPMLVSEVKAAPAIIYSDPQDGWVNSAGAFNSAVPTMFVSDNSFNQYFQSFVKFSLSGISGTLSSAKLMLYVYSSARDGTDDTTSPLQPPNGVGDTLVLHIADYGTLSASALNAPSIGNDPGVLLSSSATPNVGYVSIDVTAAMQDDINKGRAFSAFMIKTSVNTDNNNDNDSWRLSTSKQAGTNQDPYIEYTIASKLVITVYPSSVTAGSWTTKYTVQRQDQFGNPATSGSTVVNLASTSTGANKKFAETSGGSGVASVTIPDGSSMKDFYYYDDKAGAWVISVSAAGLTGDSKQLTVNPKTGCVIATATYGSELAPEVAYMRYVRDSLIGSNQIGRTLVDGWNTFYYLWSPPLAQLIAAHDLSKPIFRILLLPLVGTIHLAAYTYTISATVNTTFASLIAFLFAAFSSMVIYVVIPLYILRSALVFFKNLAFKKWNVH